MTNLLLSLPVAYGDGKHLGITSVCSAHPIVIEAALQLAKEGEKTVLIEATCNQVNQDGGYTGMTPTDFRQFVEDIANKVGLDKTKIILGGDHLGPNPWKHLPADEAMDKAEAMIVAYAKAGFTKLHLDTSMGCEGEPEALADEQTAARAARLAVAAEANKGSSAPVYVIGTEVPVPGGATHDLDELELTKPESVTATYAIHKRAFEEKGLHSAFSRVVGMVVQPGVEFGHTDVVHFDATKAKVLSASLGSLPNIVFEAHSTDYQSDENLQALVANGFSILKVGPWLTFVMREALYALDNIADVAEGHPPKGSLMAAMEDIMLSEPENWKKYYSGDETELWQQRHFSLSDRIRYYWPHPKACKAVEELYHRLEGKQIPQPVLSQYLPKSRCPSEDSTCHALLVDAVRSVLELYDSAISAEGGVK